MKNIVLIIHDFIRIGSHYIHMLARRLRNKAEPFGRVVTQHLPPVLIGVADLHLVGVDAVAVGPHAARLLRLTAEPVVDDAVDRAPVW